MFHKRQKLNKLSFISLFIALVLILFGLIKSMLILIILVLFLITISLFCEAVIHYLSFRQFEAIKSLSQSILLLIASIYLLFLFFFRL